MQLFQGMDQIWVKSFANFEGYLSFAKLIFIKL